MIKSIVKFSQLEDRLDAEYYNPAYFQLVEKIKINKYMPIGRVVKEYNTGFAPKEYMKSGIPILKVRNFQNGNIVFDGSDYATEEFFKIKPKALLQNEDIVLTTTGEGSIGKVDYYYNERQAGIVPEVTRISINKALCDPGFVYAFLSSEYGKGQFMRFVNRATGQTHLYFKDLKEGLFIPEINSANQHRIGDFIRLSLKNKKLSDQKYREAQELLNDYLGIAVHDFESQKTFSIPFSKLEDRLDGEYYRQKSILFAPVFSKGSTPLGKVTTINMGKTPSKTAYTKKGVRILKVRDLTNKGINWAENNRAFVTSEVWEKSEKSRVQEGDILLISAAHQAYYIGKELDIVFDVPEKYSDKLSAVAELLIVRSNKINPYVLLWYLRSPMAYKLIQQLITGETSHLYPKDLVNLPIPKMLLDFNKSKQLEQLTKDSMLLQKESKRLLKKAKSEVEKIIEGGKNDNSKS